MTTRLSTSRVPQRGLSGRAALGFFVLVMTVIVGVGIAGTTLESQPGAVLLQSPAGRPGPLASPATPMASGWLVRSSGTLMSAIGRLSWTQVTDPPPELATGEGVTATNFGFIATSASGAPMLSADGRDWTPLDEPGTIPPLRTVAEFSYALANRFGGLIAIETDRHSITRSYRLWDGRSWTIVGVEAPALEDWSLFGLIVSGRNIVLTGSGPTPNSYLLWQSYGLTAFRLVPDLTFGAVGPPPTVIATDDGFVAYARDPNSLALVGWTSPDGRTWTGATTAPLFGGGSLVDVAGYGGRYVALVRDPLPPWSGLQASSSLSFWASDDAVHWTKVVRPAFDADPAGHLVAGPVGFVYYSERWSSHWVPRSGPIAVSPDGVTWERLSDLVLTPTLATADDLPSARPGRSTAAIEITGVAIRRNTIVVRASARPVGSLESSPFTVSIYVDQTG